MANITYRLEVQTPAGPKVLEGEADDCVFAVKAEDPDDNISVIAAGPVEAAMLIGSLLTGLKRVSPAAFETLLEAAEEGKLPKHVQHVDGGVIGSPSPN